jgi:transposase-like protein
MGNHPRKPDGRRLFSADFKQATVTRELDIQPSVIRTWKRHYEAGATTAVAANEDVVRSPEE